MIKINKKNIIKVTIVIVMTLIFSLGNLLYTKDIINKILRLINNGLLCFMLIEVFSNIGNKVENKNMFSKKLAIINLCWGFTFILANTIEYGNILKLVNLIAVIGIGSTCYDMLSKKNKSKEINVFKFGYIWIGFVLLIPVIIILVTAGY